MLNGLIVILRVGFVTRLAREQKRTQRRFEDLARTIDVGISTT